jgi:hypothetical protein
MPSQRFGASSLDQDPGFGTTSSISVRLSRPLIASFVIRVISLLMARTCDKNVIRIASFYGDVKRSFWYPEGIGRIMLTDKARSSVSYFFCGFQQFTVHCLTVVSLNSGSCNVPKCSGGSGGGGYYAYWRPSMLPQPLGPPFVHPPMLPLAFVHPSPNVAPWTSSTHAF